MAGHRKLLRQKTIQLENYDYLYYHGLTAEDVLKTVTSGYAGNYTLAWAQSHDYKPEIKTAWVNLKGYKSDNKISCLGQFDLPACEYF